MSINVSSVTHRWLNDSSIVLRIYSYLAIQEWPRMTSKPGFQDSEFQKKKLVANSYLWSVSIISVSSIIYWLVQTEMIIDRKTEKFKNCEIKSPKANLVWRKEAKSDHLSRDCWLTSLPIIFCVPPTENGPNRNSSKSVNTEMQLIWNLTTQLIERFSIYKSALFIYSSPSNYSNISNTKGQITLICGDENHPDFCVWFSCQTIDSLSICMSVSSLNQS